MDPDIFLARLDTDPEKLFLPAYFYVKLHLKVVQFVFCNTHFLRKVEM
jgi:hypothetical protein